MWRFPKSTKSRVALWSCDSTPEHIPKQKYNSKDIYNLMFTEALYAKHNSQDMKATYISIDRWVVKEVVHIHKGILLSHKRKKIESVIVRWMSLESVTWSEEREK